MPVPVAAAAAGARQHPPPAERDLLGGERVAVPALLAVLRPALHEVERVLAVGDRVGDMRFLPGGEPPGQISRAVRHRERGAVGLQRESVLERPGVDWIEPEPTAYRRSNRLSDSVRTASAIRRATVSGEPTYIEPIATSASYCARRWAPAALVRRPLELIAPERPL